MEWISEVQNKGTIKYMEKRMKDELSRQISTNWIFGGSNCKGIRESVLHGYSTFGLEFNSRVNSQWMLFPMLS